MKKVDTYKSLRDIVQAHKDCVNILVEMVDEEDKLGFYISPEFAPYLEIAKNRRAERGN